MLKYQDKMDKMKNSQIRNTIEKWSILYLIFNLIIGLYIISYKYKSINFFNN
jgi:hypothetical protein